MTATIFSSLLVFTAATAGAGETGIPPKTNIEVSLETPIDERVTAEITAITFKLVRDVKKGDVLVAPKGATLTARVTRIQKHSAVIRNVKRNYFIVGLRLLNLTTAEGTIPVAAMLETIRPTATNDYFVPHSHAPERWGAFEEYRAAFAIPPPEAGESLFGVVREYLKVAKGVRMVFRTPDPQ